MAKATLSMRVVPNQEASEVAKSLTSYLENEFAKLESHNRMTVTIDHQAEPWLGDWTNQLFQTLEEAVMEAWGPLEHTHRRSLSHNYPTGSAERPSSGHVLANGSISSSIGPMTPMTEAANKLDSLLVASQRPSKASKKPLYIREGGSIPAIRFLEKEFNAPAAHFPCGQASDSAHLDNERLRLVNLYKSKDILKKVFRDLPQKT
jgi:di- and tripeptidase